jgi:F-type H+-transporting ATPase subunit epsilon
MAQESVGTFQCVVLTPKATLLDCRTHSVVLPAHDGQIGLWRNHMPMLCMLGLGIMKVQGAAGDRNQPLGERCFVVDGGFAQISNNVVTVLSYDITAAEDIKTDKARKLLEEAHKLTGDDAQAMQRRQHDISKAELLMLAQKSASLKSRGDIPA